LEVATRRLEEIRSVREFRLIGNEDLSVWWTPDMEPVILADHSTQEIYRLDVDW
jgi:hypothetical protein